MRKWLAKFVLLFVAATASIGFLTGQTSSLSTPKQGIAKSDHRQGGSQQPNSNDAQSSSQNTSGSTAQPSSKTDDEDRQNERENLAVQRKIAWFTGVLAAVGVLQGIVLFLTWKAIGRTADLQAFLTRQWVDVGNFYVAWEDPRKVLLWLPEEKRRQKPSKSEELRESMDLHSGFDVLNNTPNPLTLTRVLVEISKTARGSEWEPHQFVANVVLPPNRSAGDNVYTCGFAISLDSREVERYAANCFHFQIRITASFLNADKKEVTQEFHRWAMGGIGRYSFADESGWAKETKRGSSQNKSQNPN